MFPNVIIVLPDFTNLGYICMGVVGIFKTGVFMVHFWYVWVAIWYIGLKNSGQHWLL
jgi:hypothetical protein